MTDPDLRRDAKDLMRKQFRVNLPKGTNFGEVGSALTEAIVLPSTQVFPPNGRS